MNTGNYTDFISLNAPDLSFRPVGITYNEDENALYLVTIGKAEVKTQLPSGEPLPYPIPWGYPFTGAVWKITMTDTGAAQTETGTAVSNQTSVSNATDMTSSNTTTLDILTGG